MADDPTKLNTKNAHIATGEPIQLKGDTSNNKLRSINITVPLVSYLVFSLVMLSECDRPFTPEGFILLPFLFSHFLVLAFVSSSSDGAPTTFVRAMCITTFAVIIATSVCYGEVMYDIHHPTSSTAALAILALPIIGGVCAVVVFVPAYLVLRLCRHLTS